MHKTKFIVTTGGVVSGLGKGVTTASIGSLFASEYNVVPIKCDGYLNVDPGTMSPFQHGEVFVLDDKGEVDMDFGHYERFLDIDCQGEWNLTLGKIFERVINKERRGDYLGGTVQLIPHVTNFIKSWWKQIYDRSKADLVLIEIGGTVGDMENNLYIEAARQLKKEVGLENIVYVHLTYVPILENVGEPKSKPTQQSVQLLRERGIVPDIIIARSSAPLPRGLEEKIALFCDVDQEAVISGLDLDSIYKVPRSYADQGLLKILSERLGLPVQTPRFFDIKKPDEAINLAICGKYTNLRDAYASISHALEHCEHALGVKSDVKWLETSEDNDLEESLAGVNAVIVPGGFGSRGTEGKIRVIEYCRENNIPFLGICYGMQLAVIEYARHILGLADANSAEINPDTSEPVVCLLPEQFKVHALGGTMRLGGHDVHIRPNTETRALVGEDVIRRRFRHRWEVNPEYVPRLEGKGLVFSAYTPDREIMQAIELPGHPYFVGTQFHPELTSRPRRPDPHFLGLIKAAVKHKNNS
ncbi:MAG: CTP synthase (glutamine hydrolyzing) [Nanoarchaeota archaeon]